jgi:methionyl-tRNA synthetase
MLAVLPFCCAEKGLLANWACVQMRASMEVMMQVTSDDDWYVSAAEWERKEREAAETQARLAAAAKAPVLTSAPCASVTPQPASKAAVALQDSALTAL